jgi:hypothetical protein
MKLSEIKKAIKEEYASSKKVLAIGGVIVINPQVAKMKYILSDVRAVLGVTIVNNREYQSGNPSSQYEYAYLDIKIDPSPFPKESNDNANIVTKVEADIKKIRGVVTFKLKEKAHDVKTWTISETPDPQSGKSAPYGSGYAPFKKKNKKIIKLANILKEILLKEKYGELTPFYHLADKKDLDSLLKGIQIDRSDDRGQGKGFYVSNDLKTIENIQIRSVISYKSGGLIIEIKTIFNEENFDLDLELTKTLPEIIKKIKPELENKFSHFVLVHPKNNSVQFEIFVDGDGKLEDFEIDFEEINGEGLFVPKLKSGKDIKYGFIPITYSQGADNLGIVKIFIDSLDTIGVKNTIENIIYNTILDEPLYLRYVGPSIKPTRYKLKNDNGKWEEWINV